MTGGPDRPHRIKATIGGITVNGQLHAKDGSYSLTIPKHLNRPATSEELQRLGRAGTSLTVEHERYSELGARISWLRAGYLALVAMEGYKIVLDPAMDPPNGGFRLDVATTPFWRFDSDTKQRASRQARNLLFGLYALQLLTEANRALGNGFTARAFLSAKSPRTVFLRSH